MHVKDDRKYTQNFVIERNKCLLKKILKIAQAFQSFKVKMWHYMITWQMFYSKLDPSFNLWHFCSNKKQVIYFGTIKESCFSIWFCQHFLSTELLVAAVDVMNKQETCSIFSHHSCNTEIKITMGAVILCWKWYY